MRWWLLILLGFVFVGAKDTVIDSTDVKGSAEKVKQQVKTRYDIQGRPVNQSQDAKGFHRIVGEANLVSGVDTITLNTSTADGKQDVSFRADSTYHGIAWSLMGADSVRFWIVPIDGRRFIVKASDTITTTVKFQVEGE